MIVRIEQYLKRMKYKAGGQAMKVLIENKGI